MIFFIFFIINFKMSIDRTKGKDALKTVLKQEQNVNVIEKYVYDMNNENESYYATIYEVINDIKKGMPLSDILKSIKKKDIMWAHHTLKEYIYEENEQNNFIITPFQIEEGIAECKCGSKRVFSYQKQSRSCDEPSTSFYECVACKNKWCYSG